MEKKEKTKKEKKSPLVLDEETMKKRQMQSYRIGLLSAIGLAIILIIVEGCLGHFSSIFALACICFTWGAVYYILQFCLVKREWAVLTIGIVDAVIALAMFVFFIMSLIW